MVALLSQARDPVLIAQVADGYAEAGDLDAMRDAIVAAVTDPQLVDATLRYAGVTDHDGLLTAQARVRLGQAAVLLEVAADPATPRWDLVLTVPGFLQGALAAFAADHGDGAVPRQTGQAMLEVSRTARRRLIIAAPFLHAEFTAMLAADVERVLSDGGEVLILTRALSLASPYRSSANIDAVETLRAAAMAGGRALTVRSWEETGLGVHFKVLVADDTVAYLGSANLTPGGAAGHAEAGVLVRGGAVTTLRRWLQLVAGELSRREPR